MTNPDDQAFPRSYAHQNPEAGKSELKSMPGMTKREAFAIAAMQGLLSSQGFPNRYFAEVNHLGEPGHPDIFEACARTVLLYADALIAALNAPPEGTVTNEVKP